MGDSILNDLADESQHRGQANYRADGLRILARMIAKAYLRDSQLNSRKSNKHEKRETK